MSVPLRAYRPEDLEPILELFRASVQSLASSAYTPAQLEAWAPAAPDRSGWARRLAALEVLVAEDSEGLLGFIGWRGDATIDLLFVHPRAARSGVATALYEEAERRLRNTGCLVLLTHASDIARPFFAKRGFVVVRENAVRRGDVVLRNHTMQKSLSPA